MPYIDIDTKKAYASYYYELNKEKLKARAQAYYQEHKAKSIENTKQYLRDNFEYQLYRNAKSSAKQRNLEFNLDRSDVVIPEYCPYLGVKLTRIVDGGRQDTNASLDRLDNSKGYVKGNIQVISSKANFMKRNATIDELVIFAKGVLKTHS